MINKDEGINLDNLEKTESQPKLVISKWRKEEINGNYNQFIGTDELRKIQGALKKKYPDHNIMEAYGVNAQTLTAIKEGRYSPTEGIKCDNPTKIFNEIKRLENRFYGIKCLAEELSKILFTSKKEQKAFVNILNKRNRSVEKFTFNDEEE